MYSAVAREAAECYLPVGWPRAHWADIFRDALTATFQNLQIGSDGLRGHKI